MINSAIFETQRQIYMNISIRSTFLLILTLTYAVIQSQYTETINSNRPGQSQGAFAVGTSVLQFESGAFLGNEIHTLLNTDTDIVGLNFSARYGVWKEALEINTIIQLQSNTTTFTTGATNSTQNTDFSRLSLGAKYLVYDPYKNRALEKPNLYSYHDQFKFKWKTLIPAVSVYGGVNYRGSDNSITPPQLEGFSPIVLLATQNNWARWVWVNNFMFEDFTTDFSSFTWITTLTRSIAQKWAVFGEFQLINGDLNIDQIFRLGGAYLILKDLQVDISGLTNFKDTPSRIQAEIGLSYRLDFHKSDEHIQESKTKKSDKVLPGEKKSKKKKKKRKNRKDAIDFEDDGDGIQL